MNKVSHNRKVASVMGFFAVLGAVLGITLSGGPGGHAPVGIGRPSTTHLIRAGLYTPHVGTQMHASNGIWMNTVTTFDYQWQDCNSAGASCVPVGSDSALYTPVVADQGKFMDVIVTASNSFGNASQTSLLTAAVQPAIVQTIGTGPSQAVCSGGACGAIQSLTTSLGVPDGAGSTFSRNFFVFFPTGLSGSVPVEVTFSDGQACSTNVSTCVDGAEGFINIAAQKKFIVVDVRCTPTDHGVTIGSNGCNYFTPDAYPVQAAGTTFAYCGPGGGTQGNPTGQNCDDARWFDGLLNTYLPAHMSTFCTGGACTLDTSRVFLEGGSKGFSLTQQLMCSPITGPQVDGAFGGSTLQSSVFTTTGPPSSSNPSAAASCPYLLQQSGTYPSSTYTYTGTGITHPIMFGYWDGLGDHPEAQNGILNGGRWTYSEDQMAGFLQGPNYGCPSTFSSSSTLTPVAGYSGGAVITGHVYNCGGPVAGGTVWIRTGGVTGSGSCHAGSCDGTLAANQTIADGFQFGPEMWSFWTTGTFI